LLDVGEVTVRWLRAVGIETVGELPASTIPAVARVHGGAAIDSVAARGHPIRHRTTSTTRIISLHSDDADRLAVERLRDEWVRAIAARDPEALREFLTDDYEVWANAAQPIRGVDDAIAAMRGALERFDVAQSFDPIETVVCGDWAFERGIERMTVTPIGGGPPRSASQRALLILRRDADGRWRYARGMTNGLPPAQ
jgi:uncharacterized protein (TIGR02246 family)